MPEPHRSNLAVSYDLNRYDPPFHLLVTALEHSCMSVAMSISSSVPIKFVAEAASSFLVRDNQSFTFSVNGKRKMMNKAKFFKLFHLSVSGELETPMNKEIFEMINEMGHQSLVHSSSQVYLSKLPDVWALFYTLVIYSLCGVVPSRGKINMNQMMMMYGVFHNSNVGIDEFVYNEFITECRSRRVGDIMYHRFWSVIVDDVLRKDFPGETWDDLPKMAIHVATPPGPKVKSTIFEHVGHIPEALLAEIPADNEVLQAFTETCPCG